MLYPDFNDLISYKSQRADKIPTSRKEVGGTLKGNYHSPFRGQGLEFDSVREYVPGDDIRTIDWRVTARTGSPHIKIYKEEKQRDTILCVDMNSTMRFGTRSTFKSIQAARCTSFLGWRSLAQQDRISACFFGDVTGGVRFYGSKHTRKALCMILKTMVGPPVEEHQVSLETAMNHIYKVAQPGSVIYLISDFMDLSPDFEEGTCLRGLTKRSDVVFISINDRADQTLAPAGIIGFCGQNADRQYVNTDSIKGRQAYTAQWDKNRNTLRSLSKRFHIPLIELSTESDIRHDLYIGLKNITKRGRCLL